MRTLTVKPPRLPAVAPAASDGTSSGSGPLLWEWTSERGPVTDEAEKLNVLVDIGGYVFASCPGATSYRLEYIETGPLPFDAVTNGVLITCDQYLTAYLYATVPGLGELGPITLVVAGV